MVGGRQRWRQLINLATRRSFGAHEIRQESTFSSAKLWIGRIVSHNLQLGQCHMKRCVL